MPKEGLVCLKKVGKLTSDLFHGEGLEWPIESSLKIIF